jgi:predicted amidophosphoribosyltransferase
MRAQAATPLYEVYCNQCQVTFPAGNRRCLHCGSRLQSDRASHDLVLPPEFEGEVTADETGPKRRRGVSPVAGIWLVLAVVITIVRSCSGG